MGAVTHGQVIKRSSPNILVTGTPGVGKTTICKRIQEVTQLKWIEVSTFAEKHNCLEGYDEELKCPYLNEDRLLDLLEEHMTFGGKIVDYHGSDFFPERWFDIIIVLSVDNTTLYDRLTDRGYSGKKLDDNLQCEIFKTIEEETLNSYKRDKIHILENNTQTQFENNVEKVSELISEFMSSDT